METLLEGLRARVHVDDAQLRTAGGLDGAQARPTLSIAYSAISFRSIAKGAGPSHSSKIAVTTPIAGTSSSCIRSSTASHIASSAATWRRQVNVPHAMCLRSSSPMCLMICCIPGKMPRLAQIFCHEK
ncbi:hypothetical protein BJF90_23470 [Pseudonocardia sp. CNS-004]|nr:hypothetical protein BJF90_23470 [Pseudonocardia sp. CNS-004]